jgi:putative endonuclease
MGRRQEIGRYGEDVAARYLAERGMAVLARNWRCRLGELDIVARDGVALVICEVKTRSGRGYGSPFDAITPVKLARLHRLAAEFLHQSGLQVPRVRIDCVAVLRSPIGPAAVEHRRGIC